MRAPRRDSRVVMITSPNVDRARGALLPRGHRLTELHELRAQDQKYWKVGALLPRGHRLTELHELRAQDQKYWKVA
jgi:hypothetical protein